jgi:hypothetical protein
MHLEYRCRCTLQVTAGLEVTARLFVLDGLVTLASVTLIGKGGNRPGSEAGRPVRSSGLDPDRSAFDVFLFQGVADLLFVKVAILHPGFCFTDLHVGEGSQLIFTGLHQLLDPFGRIGPEQLAMHQLPVQVLVIMGSSNEPGECLRGTVRGVRTYNADPHEIGIEQRPAFHDQRLSFSHQQPTQDGSAEIPVPDDAESLLFTQASENMGVSDTAEGRRC